MPDLVAADQTAETMETSMDDTTWHECHTEDPPTLPEVTARWCATCNRMIVTDDGRVTLIGAKVCGIDMPATVRLETIRQ